MKRVICLGVLVMASAFAVPASAAPVIDQQQPVIDTGAGFEWGVGGTNAEKQVLAQVVTPGLTGTLTEVRLAGSCWVTPLTVEVQNVTSGIPNGTVRGSQTSLFSFIPDTGFHGIVFATPVPVHAGVPYAVLLSTSGSCGMWPGPIGDPYAGGDSFARNQFDPPGAWYPNSNGTGRSDLPFQTLVDQGAAGQLAALGDAVKGVGPGTSLADKVKDAQAALGRNDVPGTCSILGAFINQVKAQTGKGILSTTAAPLIADASRIKTVLGC